MRQIDADNLMSRVKPLCEEDAHSAVTIETAKKLIKHLVDTEPTLIIETKPTEKVKELIENLKEEADAVQAIEWEIPICTQNHILEAAETIEELLAEIEQYKSYNAELHEKLAEAKKGTGE